MVITLPSPFKGLKRRKEGGEEAREGRREGRKFGVTVVKG
jgi:hypothetical protein